jgi:hypothetical protein
MKQGIVVSGGIDRLNFAYRPQATMVINKSPYRAYSEAKGKFDLSAGYLLRLQSNEPQHVFFDFSANVGMRKWELSYLGAIDTSKPYSLVIQTVNNYNYYAYVGVIVNFHIYKGLNIGAGIEPSFIFAQDRTGEASLKEKKTSNKLDLPIVGRIAYDFGIFELGLKYKYGTLYAVETTYIRAGHFQDWELSIFVPF